MPFTFAHPAAVLPFTGLSKRYYSLTGLIIGSIAPDFEYFIRMSMKGEYGHTLYGILWFDLPLGLILAFVFHNIVRNVLADNLPLFLKSRLSTFSSFNWNTYFQINWHIVSLSIIIGTGTHLLWDSFTHYNGYFVEYIPALANKVEVASFSFPLFKVLQHVSSIMGGLIIFYTIYSLPQKMVDRANAAKQYWGLILAITIASILIRKLCGLHYNEYGSLIAAAISGFLIAIIVVSFAFKRRVIHS